MTAIVLATLLSFLIVLVVLDYSLAAPVRAVGAYTLQIIENPQFHIGSEEV